MWLLALRLPARVQGAGQCLVPDPCASQAKHERQFSKALVERLLLQLSVAVSLM